MMQYAELGDTLYFWFAANDTSGSGGDGATPLADVRLAGAAASAAPVFSPTPSLLTDAGYPAGCHEVAVPATTGNGFADNQTYAVFSTLAIDSQNPTGFIGSFQLGKLQTAADLGLILETTIATLTSQTQFTLTDGSDQDGEYVTYMMMIEDADNTFRRTPVRVTNYTGATKAVILDPNTVTSFTAAIGDKVRVFAAPVVLPGGRVDLGYWLGAQPLGLSGQRVQTEDPKLVKYVRLMLRDDAAIKTDHAAELGEINSDEGSGAGAYDPINDAMEQLGDLANANFNNTGTLRNGVITGTASAGTLSTTQATTGLSSYAADALKGRVIIWYTGTAVGAAAEITANTAGGLITWSPAIPNAPSDGDAFKIV